MSDIEGRSGHRQSLDVAAGSCLRTERHERPKRAANSPADTTPTVAHPVTPTHERAVGEREGLSANCQVLPAVPFGARLLENEPYANLETATTLPIV
jgi:hypothetical protein